MKEIVQKELLYPEIIWERPVHYYKHEGGKVLIIAGSRNNPQKAILACESVFRSGTGILTLGFPEKLKEIYQYFLPDTMKLSLPETFGGSISQKAKEEVIEYSKTSDSFYIGPGLSNNAETIHLTWELIFEINLPTVVCDNGLSAFIKGIEVLRSQENEAYLIDYLNKKNNLCLIFETKDSLNKLIHACNLKEVPKTARLDNDASIRKTIQALSEILNIGLVFTGENGYVAINNLFLINKIGSVHTPILPGIISSFLAQNPSKPFEAIATALYLHGNAELLAKQNIGDRPVVSADILRYLPTAIKSAENHQSN